MQQHFPDYVSTLIREEPLERDYRAMKEMLFGDIPDLSELLDRLDTIQNRISKQ